MNGKLFILSGQSGVGKNTILKAVLAKHPEFHRAVTFTTRDQRPEEIAGEDHYFVYRKKFDEMIKKSEFLEYAENHGQMYGTPKEQIEKALSSGKNVLMEIDVKGATQVKKIMPEAILILLKYDSNDIDTAIRNRIVNDESRGDIPEEEIKSRIATAKKELEYEKYYDYSVINPEGSPEQAIRDVENIIQMNSKRISTLLSFLKTIEALKHVERRVYIKGDTRAENAAEHSWHVAMFVFIFEKEFPKLNHEKMYKMALIHDLVEIYAGDTFAYDKEGKKSQKAREKKALSKLLKQLPSDIAKEFETLFFEYENGTSKEGQVVRSFDKIQAPLQVIICGGGAWRINNINVNDIDAYKRQFMTHDENIMTIYNEVLKDIKNILGEK